MHVQCVFIQSTETFYGGHSRSNCHLLYSAYNVHPPNNVHVHVWLVTSLFQLLIRHRLLGIRHQAYTIHVHLMYMYSAYFKQVHNRVNDVSLFISNYIYMQ